VDLDAEPFKLELELLPELVDDALADEAEGSDVVGKDAYADGHDDNLRTHSLRLLR
jgi:hypothetical protein